MPARRQGGNRQPELFARSKRPTIALPDNHPMVVLTNTVDWTEMEMRAERIRTKKLKNAAGRPPQLRATLGALTLMAIRKMPYREAEEQIRYYAPARYLCGLTETDWTPDFTTIQDFAQLLGEDGCRLINEAVVEQAVALGLADPKVAVADMTAQEAAIPHPNETSSGPSGLRVSSPTVTGRAMSSTRTRRCPRCRPNCWTRRPARPQADSGRQACASGRPID
jgi:hypothetical protein